MSCRIQTGKPHGRTVPAPQEPVAVLRARELAYIPGIAAVVNVTAQLPRAFHLHMHPAERAAGLRMQTDSLIKTRIVDARKRSARKHARQRNRSSGRIPVKLTDICGAERHVRK